MSSRPCNYCSLKETHERHKDNLRMERKDGWDSYYMIKFEPESKDDNGFVCSVPTGSDKQCGC